MSQPIDFGEVMRIAVTGATGFVGQALCNHLNQQNLPYIALARSPQKDCEQVDFTNTSDLQAALKGCSSVIHLIGQAHNKGANTAAAFEYTNVTLAKQVAKAALAVGVKRFIYLSSVKALGESTQAGHPFTNISPARPTTQYGQSKLQAEHALAKTFAGSECELVIVRPPLIWGEKAKGNLATIQRWISLGLPLPLGGIENRRHWLALPRLCDFLSYLATTAKPLNNLPPLLIADPNQLSTPQAIGRLLEAQNQHARFISLPPWLWRSLRKIPFTRGITEKLTGSLELDCTQTYALTGWQAANLEDAPCPPN